MSGHVERFSVLDGMRGIAAIVVVVWHCALGFFPQITGQFDTFPASESWMGKPWFLFINGSGAVAFFFVLSGFVLTFGALTTGDSRQVTVSLIKRWPRLAVPVVLSTMVSWAFFYFNVYDFAEAGLLSGSPWLVNFSYATEIPYNRSLFEAFAQGSFFTFFRGDAYFNSSLWTMRYEFIGSMMVFGLAYFVLSAGKSKISSLYLCVMLFLLVSFVSFWYAAFLMGVLVSIFYFNVTRLNLFLRCIAIAAGLFCLAYSAPVGPFVIFGSVNSILVQSAGSVLLIIACVRIAPRRIYVRIFQVLGELSFPIYLIHIPILASVGSAVYVSHFHDNAVLAAFYATATTIFVSLLASYPILIINRYWLMFLNGLVRKYFSTSRNSSGPIYSKVDNVSAS